MIAIDLIIALGVLVVFYSGYRLGRLIESRIRK